MNFSQKYMGSVLGFFFAGGGGHRVCVCVYIYIYIYIYIYKGSAREQHLWSKTHRYSNSRQTY